MDRSRARRVLAAGAAALALAGLASAAAPTAGLAREGGRGHLALAVAAPITVPSPAPPPAGPPVPPPAWIATLHTPTAYRVSPGGPARGTLPATNPFGGAEVLAVVGVPLASGWARVELPIRPNGSQGWINTVGVALSETSYQVVVNVEARRVSVTDAGRPVLTIPAAVGRPSTPTPLGHTYLWELIRPDDPKGAYGPYIFGLGWYSDAYSVFNGGDAQIGIHGQDEPWSIGQAASHGCVRLTNDMISRLAGLLPLGTPVTIV